MSIKFVRHVNAVFATIISLALCIQSVRADNADFAATTTALENFQKEINKINAQLNSKDLTNEQREKLLETIQAMLKEIQSAKGTTFPDQDAATNQVKVFTASGNEKSKKGDWTNALAEYDKGMKLVKQAGLSNDESFGLQLARAYALEKSGNIESAEVAYLERALSMRSPAEWTINSDDEKSSFREAISNLGVFLIQHRKFRKAEHLYTKYQSANEYCKDNATKSIWYNNLGTAQLNQGKFSEAQETLSKGAELASSAGPNGENTALRIDFHRAEIFNFQHKRKAGQKLLSKYVDSTDPKIKAQLQELTQKLDKQPNFQKPIHSSLDLGIEYCQRGCWSKAQNLFQEALGSRKLSPQDIDNITGWHSFAINMEGGGGSKIDPENPSAPDSISAFVDSCDAGDLNAFEVLPKYYPAEREARDLLNKRLLTLPENHPLIGQSYRYLAHIIFQQKDYKNAVEYLEKSACIFKLSLGVDHLIVAETLAQLSVAQQSLNSDDFAFVYSNKIGQSALAFSDFESSDHLSLLRRDLANLTFFRCYSKSSDELIRKCKDAIELIPVTSSKQRFRAVALRKLGDLYISSDCETLAVACFKTALSIWKEYDDALHCAYFSQLIAQHLWVEDTFDGENYVSESPKWYEEARKYYTRICPDTSPAIARIDITLAQFRPRDIAGYVKAFTNLQNCLGKDCLEIGKAGESLAIVLAKTDPLKAEEILNASQAIKNRHIKPSIYEAGDDIQNQGFLKESGNDYVQAEQLYCQYYEVKRKVMPKFCPLISSYRRKALEYFCEDSSIGFKMLGEKKNNLDDPLGNYAFPTARELLSKKALLANKSPGNDFDIADVDLGLAVLFSMRTHSDVGFNKKAFDRFKKLALTVDESNRLAGALIINALTFADHKQYELAQEAASLCEKKIEQSRVTAASRDRSFNLFYRLADFYKTTKYFGSARSACDKARSLVAASASPIQLAQLSILESQISLQQNDFTSAEKYAFKAVKIAKNVSPQIFSQSLIVASDASLAANHLDSAYKAAMENQELTQSHAKIFSITEIEQAKQNLAKICVARNETEKGLELINSINYSELNGLLSESSRITNETYETKLEIALKARNFQEARNCAATASGWPRNAEKVLLEKPFSEWLNDVNTIARVLAMDGHHDQAADTSLKAAAMIDKYISQTFHHISFPEQCSLASALRLQADSLLTYACQPATVEQSYSYLSKWKGFLLSALEMRAKQRKISESSNPSLVSNLESLESELANLQDVKERNLQSIELEHKLLANLEQLQRQVSKVSLQTAQNNNEENKLGSLQAKLGNDECLIDIYKFRRPGEKESRYGAFIIQEDAINFRELGESKVVDAKIYASRNAILGEVPSLLATTRDAAPSITPTKRTQNETSSSGMILASLVPNTATKVRFCADGEFSLLPPSEFFGADLRVTCEDRLASQKLEPAQQAKSKTVMLVGNVNFAGHQPALHFSRKETEEIYSLAKRENLDVTSLTGYEATKEAVKRQIKNSSIVHIATHGYFNGSDSFAARDPLLTSGLVLAAKPTSTSMSLLTAEEIAQLNLSKVDIVTLSACQTGRGRVFDGQGIIGLRAAFLAAGARSIVMSLWPVDDEATALLMRKFYEALWLRDRPPREALKEAQKEVQSNSRWSAPFYWAGWVIVGQN